MISRLDSTLLRSLILAVSLSGAMAAPSFAQKAETEEKSASPRLTLRVGEHPTFDRLVFDGPRGLAYTLRREGSTVTLAFSAPAKVDLRPAANLSRARHLAVVAETPKLSLRFTVAPKALLKDFVSASSIVIDISGPNASAEIPPPAPSKPEPPKAEEKPAPVSESAKPAPIASPPPVSETKEQSSASAQPLKTEPTAPLPAAVVPPPAQPVAPPPTPAPTVPVTATPAPAAMAVPPLPEIGAMPVLIATLDPKIDLGAAIFERGGYVNILFDRKLTSSPVVLANGAPLHVTLQPFDLPHNSCFRFALPPLTEVRATRVDTAWQIFLTRQRSEVPVSTRLVAQPDFALGARLILPTTNAPDPVKFIDPTVGDTLFVVPLRDTTAFNVNRRMADLFLLPTAQGLVIKPLHEKVVVRSVSDGVEITAEGGLKLSPASDTGAAPQGARKTRKAMPGKTMFDFDLWRGKPNETFTETRQKLMQSVADVTESQRNLARIDLARFYFAHSMGEETLALLTILTQQMPDLTTRPEFLALRGAARLLADRAQEGLRDLDAPGLESLPEIDLWQGVGAAQLRDWTTAEEKFSFAEDVLANYPEPFFSRFSVLAIESALAANKDREAAEWLDRLETQPHLPEIIPAMRYLRGVLHSKSGHADTAENLWRSVAKSNDRLYKIRAELALIDLGVATQSLTPAQAIERLEGLRYAWRGDDLEIDILHRLGSFYFENKNYRPGFTVLNQATRLYPNSPLTPILRAEMTKTFHDLYLTDLGANLSPIDGLTLFQDFRDLMPSGADGNAMRRNLAERLVAIDLLEQAADLLEDQIKNSAPSNDRADVGARLAAIRLLDHKPDKALASLDISSSDNLPEDLQTQRVLLRARALSEQKKFDEALALLQNNTDLNAKMLRADITMRAQRWSDAAKALQELIGPPPKAGELITESQAQWLVNCAIALSLSNDNNGLDRLAIDYGAAMAGTAQKDTFRVLTRPEKAGQMRDIAAAQAKITEVDMFRGFLDNYRGARNSENKAEIKGAKKPSGKTP